MQPSSDLDAPRPSTVTQLFLVQENVILLGGAALFSVSLASPLPLVAAVAGELLWLGVGSSSPGVRRWLDARRTAIQGAQTERDGPASESLDPEYAQRVFTFDRAFAAIRGFGSSRSRPEFGRAVSRLETLGPVYRGLCETHQRIGRFLTTKTEAELAAEVERLKAQFTAEKDLGVRLTLRQAIGAAQRLVEQRQRMSQLRRAIGVKLESAERSMAYFVSQGLALGSNPGFPEEVETLLSEIGPAITADGS